MPYQEFFAQAAADGTPVVATRTACVVSCVSTARWSSLPRQENLREKVWDRTIETEQKAPTPTSVATVERSCSGRDCRGGVPKS